MKNLIRGYPILLLAVLVMVSCGTKKHLETISQHQQQTASHLLATDVQQEVGLESSSHLLQAKVQDSQMVLKMETQAIPEDSSQMTIPIQSLMDLPDGAVFRTQEGRSSVEVNRQGDNVIVTGKCDSIQRQCLYYESQVFRQRSTIDSLRDQLSQTKQYVSHLESNTATETAEDHIAVEQEKPPTVWHIWLFVGILVGIALSIAVSILYNKTRVGGVIKGLILKIFNYEL